MKTFDVIMSTPSPFLRIILEKVVFTPVTVFLSCSIFVDSNFMICEKIIVFISLKWIVASFTFLYRSGNLCALN